MVASAPMDDTLADWLVDAERELREKSRSEIEEETAFKWAARAVVAYRIFRETHRYRWLLDSEHFREEAIEHAALADEDGEVLRAVQEWMRRYIPAT
jgi:hypothetical protein